MSETVTVALSTEMLRGIKTCSQARQMARSDYIRWALQRAIDAERALASIEEKWQSGGKDDGLRDPEDHL
jgi:hypothetical protein